jgi:hypothetical protein
MLAVTSYSQDYIDDCRRRIEAQLAAHSALASTAGQGDPSTLAAFDALFFNNLVLVLDHCFVHRTRAIEGKDGNPLNEVRMLASSILRDGCVLAADKTIKYKAESAVLHLAVGDEIRLDEAQFASLSRAYFAEVEHKFT